MDTRFRFATWGAGLSIFAVAAGAAVLACGQGDSAADLGPGPGAPESPAHDAATTPTEDAGTGPTFGGDGGGPASCQVGQTRPCSPPAPAGSDAGLCAPGQQSCVRSGEFSQWDTECAGAIFAQPRGVYTARSSGGGSGQTNPVCCDPGDTLKQVVDCGTGSNHRVERRGANCAIGIEGPNNGGGPCARITCESTRLMCPKDGG